MGDEAILHFPALIGVDGERGSEIRFIYSSERRIGDAISHSQSVWGIRAPIGAEFRSSHTGDNQTTFGVCFCTFSIIYMHERDH